MDEASMGGMPSNVDAAAPQREMDVEKELADHTSSIIKAGFNPLFANGRMGDRRVPPKEPGIEPMASPPYTRLLTSQFGGHTIHYVVHDDRTPPELDNSRLEEAFNRLQKSLSESTSGIITRRDGLNGVRDGHARIAAKQAEAEEGSVQHHSPATAYFQSTPTPVDNEHATVQPQVTLGPSKRSCLHQYRPYGRNRAIAYRQPVAYHEPNRAQRLVCSPSLGRATG